MSLKLTQMLSMAFLVNHGASDNNADDETEGGMNLDFEIWLSKYETSSHSMAYNIYPQYILYYNLVYHLLYHSSTDLYHLCFVCISYYLSTLC